MPGTGKTASQAVDRIAVIGIVHRNKARVKGAERKFPFLRLLRIVPAFLGGLVRVSLCEKIAEVFRYPASIVVFNVLFAKIE